MDQDILVVESLKKYFPIRAGIFGRVKESVRAVDDISFAL